MRRQISIERLNQKGNVRKVEQVKKKQDKFQKKKNLEKLEMAKAKIKETKKHEVD